MSATFDSREFRDALGRFATGIAIVTTQAENGDLVGLTINSFNSVSLEPPLVLWSLADSSPNLETFRNCSHYAIHILADDQEYLSQHFATRQEDKFATIPWQPGLGGAPLLENCCARFQVANQTRHPGGDHLIFVGQVETCDTNPERNPLLYFGGNYRLLARD